MSAGPAHPARQVSGAEAQPDTGACLLATRCSLDSAGLWEGQRATESVTRAFVVWGQLCDWTQTPPSCSPAQGVASRAGVWEAEPWQPLTHSYVRAAQKPTRVAH